MILEPVVVAAFREWLADRGGYVHSNVRFVKDTSGMSVHTIEQLPPDTRVVSCPFPLAVTPSLSKRALGTFTQINMLELDKLSERELICMYIVLHWILEDEPSLKSATAFDHLPYLHTLPPTDALQTALHFNDGELSLFRGTNLFGATVDRKAEWQAEWMRCRDIAGKIRQEWVERFTRQRYFTASTYLSSRAFPSTVMSKTPSLFSTESSHPILLPGVDSLNHARSHRVSWVVGDAPTQMSLSSEIHPQISLVIHDPTPANSEVFNNYGPKPNSELILGYGFSLPSNPDDTIVLKIGGQEGATNKRWEVGRGARGAEGLWDELKGLFRNGGDDEEDAPTEWEVELEAAETLKDMVGSKIAALPELQDSQPADVRSEVWRMAQHYIQGQRDVLESLSAFADTRRDNALTKAKEEGVDLEFDEDE